MGKSFKRRWNKARIQKLKALRNPTDEFVNAGTAAVETVKEIIHTLSEPGPETVVEEVVTAPAPAATTPKRRRRRTAKKTTTVE
tara:strand:+ start:383 stop:634 length:252 start_codon:yes stop_codon:yes gene_type:complete